MRSNTQMQWDNLSPLHRQKTVAARKLLRAARHGDTIDVVLHDPELLELGDADEILGVVRVMCVAAAQVPAASIPDRDWFSRSAAQLLLA